MTYELVLWTLIKESSLTLINNWKSGSYLCLDLVRGPMPDLQISFKTILAGKTHTPSRDREGVLDDSVPFKEWVWQDARAAVMVG